MRRILRKLVLFTFVSSLFSGCATAVSTKFPAELATISNENGCAGLNSYFDHPDQKGHPYVYGVLPGPKANSAALWCRSAKDQSISLLVVGTMGDSAVLDELPYPNFPGSLALLDRNKFDERYGRLSKALKPISQKLNELNVESETVIVSEFDGVLAHFYIHDGNWWYFIAH